MDVINYDVRKYPWYSPHLVIRAFGQLINIHGHDVETKREYKLAKEMFESAIALLGSYELDHGNKYFMQPNLQSNSPDVMAAKLTESENDPVNLEVTQMELVRMEDHAGTNNVFEFLEKTKFSKKKSYDEKTLIVCIVNKKTQVNRMQLAQRFRDMNPLSTVYVVGKLQNSEQWVIFSPFPVFTKSVFYNLGETLKKYSLPEVISLHRGWRKEIEYVKVDRKTTTIYDIFDIKNSNEN
jgi:hypothetical protein